MGLLYGKGEYISKLATIVKNTNFMEININKIEELLYENDSFMKLKNIIKNKKRTIFNIIVKDSDELTFSRTLKYFFDPQEDHNLNDYFLREFLYKVAILNKSANINRLYFDSLNLTQCNVHREFPIKEYGRIDVFIELKSEFALILENKLYSEEGNEQTKRYEEWASINLSKKYKHLLFCFLTPDGRLAETDKFISISINDIIPIFKNESNFDLLNQDNRYLLEHFSNWMEDLKMTDSNIKKLCQSIYKKYKNEIDLIVENAPTITSFVKDLSNYINKNGSQYVAHSGKDWMTLSPKDWIGNEKLKESSKYSKVRVEFDYFSDSSNFIMALASPNKDEFINIIKNNSNALFNANYDIVQNWNNWGNKYFVFQKWESFQIDDYIEKWDENIKYFAEQIIIKIQNVDNILSKELKTTVANSRS